jgi:hypothetical protein
VCRGEGGEGCGRNEVWGCEGDEGDGEEKFHWVPWVRRAGREAGKSLEADRIRF